MSETEKRLTKMTQDKADRASEWSQALATRLKGPTNVAIDAILCERYPMKDAAAHREPREYAQKIPSSAKDANMISVLYQLDIIYNGLDLELRRDIKRPDDKSTINSFLAGMDDSKHEWWAYYRHGRIPGTPLGITQGNRQPRLPDNNRGDNQFQSRQYQQWQGPGFGRQPFPPCY